MKRILIIYTSHSAGHQRIGENIGWHLERGGYEVKYFDALGGKKARSVAGWLFLFNVVYQYAPWFWRWLYLHGYKGMSWLRLPVARWQAGPVRAAIRDYHPDMVITTETAPSAVMSVLKSRGEFNGLFGIAFSDYHFHPYWAYPGADFYLANIVEQVSELEKLGVAKERVAVCGMTLVPHKVVDQIEVRKRLAVPEDALVVLVASGSMGLRMPEELVKVLQYDVMPVVTASGKKLHVLFMCGKNEALRKESEQRFIGDPHVHVLGWYVPADELYAVADLFITKPGGLSIAESLSWNIPVAVTHILPGQEELNIGYLKIHALVHDLHQAPPSQWGSALAEVLLKSRKTGNLHLKTPIYDTTGIEVVRAVGQAFHGQ